MLTLNYFSELKEKTIEGLKKRNWDTERLAWVEKAAALDIERKDIQTDLDNLKSEVNAASKEIGTLMREGKLQEVEIIKNNVAVNKSKITELEDRSRQNKEELQEILYKIPNIPNSTCLLYTSRCV